MPVYSDTRQGLSDEDDSQYRGSKCKYGPKVKEGIRAVEVKGDCGVTVSLLFFSFKCTSKGG